MGKLPAIQFYPGDWRKDSGIQSLNYHEKGVWMEILFFMHESEQRGKLLLNGKPVPEDRLSRMLHLDKQETNTLINTFLSLGVADICPDTGALMNRRMVRDEKIREQKAEAGRTGGGNPLFTKGNANPYYEKDKQKDKHPDKQKDKQKIGSSVSSSVSSSSSKHKPENSLKSGKPKNQDLEDLWTKCLEMVKSQTSAESHHLLEDTFPSSLHGATLCIAVPNQFTRKAMIEQYREMIELFLHQISNKKMLVDFRIERH